MDHKLEYKPPKDEEDKKKDRDELPTVKMMPKNVRGHGDDGTTGTGAPGVCVCVCVCVYVCMLLHDGLRSVG